MQVGQTIRSRYRIIKYLSGGGFGSTYLAEDMDAPTLPKPKVVIKRLHPSVATPKVKELFEKEAQILYELGKNYDRVPRVSAYFEDNGDFFLVQDFIDGADLTTEIGLGKRWDEKKALAFLDEMLEILIFIQKQGIIHRDIKPANIMRRYADNKFVLIDFGAVKQIRQSQIEVGQASYTVAIGTEGYMPSEQANFRPCLGSDIYSLGITVIQSLMGINDPRNLNRDVNTGELVWRSQVGQISDQFAEVLDKMVRDHFSQRYPDAAAVKEALLKTIVAPPPPPPDNRRRRFLQLLGLGGTAFVGAVLLNSPKSKLINTPIPSQSSPTTSFQNYSESLPNGVNLTMIAVRGGKFKMGAPSGVGADQEKPQHDVSLSEFYIGQYEVTQSQWFALMGNYEGEVVDGKTFRQGFSDHLSSEYKDAQLPIVNVNWHDAREFCRRLSQLTGKAYRLPTEAEWEYAARGGSQSRNYIYAGSNNPDEVGWYGKNSGYRLHPVGQKRANEIGLYDMSGNVYEWCEDGHHQSYSGKPQDLQEHGNQAWDESTKSRVIRGGSWIDLDGYSSRSTARSKSDTITRIVEIGFRVVV